MKLKYTLLFIASVFGLQAGAQTWVIDSADMSGGYANDVFYSMKNGVVKTESNTNWHIAFMTTPPGPNGNVSVMANHVQGGVKVYSLSRSATANFTSYTSVAASDTATQLYNADTSWMWGALNNNRVVSDPFDYGWGRYNMGTHNVDGDTLYLLNTPAGMYKLWIQHYRSTPSDSVQYRFRIAKLDNSEDTIIRIYRKPVYENKLFAYYDIVNKTFRDREPVRNGWDIMFTRYITTIMMPSPTPYPVMGVMSNVGVRAADVRNVDPDTVNYLNHMSSATMMINEIGYDWKTFNNSTFQWELDTTATFYVLSINSHEIYQVVFTRFDGTSIGKTVFKKRKVADIPVTSVSNATQQAGSLIIVPNPATDRMDIVLDITAVSDARLTITDITGKIIMNRSVHLNKGLNALGMNVSAYPAGTYIVSVSDGAWKLSKKIVVQH